MMYAGSVPADFVKLDSLLVLRLSENKFIGEDVGDMSGNLYTVVLLVVDVGCYSLQRL